ncbi:MAG: ATP-binding protein [bacterium]
MTQLRIPLDTKKKCILLAVIIVIISGFHYSTVTALAHFHEIYRRLFFIPIILAAFWFGTRGGIVTAAAVTVAYLPHVMFQWGGDILFNMPRIMEILLYNAIGLVTGMMASAEKRQRVKYQQASAEVERAYKKLQEQTDRLMRLEEQLRSAERLSTLGELMAGVAHEIRNPLGSIRGAAEILAGAIGSDSKKREFADILIKEVKRLDEVVQNYLHLAKSPHPSKGRWELEEVIGSVLSIVKTRTKEKNIEMKLEIEKGLSLEADRNQLIQVFLNIILNSLDAIDAKGTIHITARREDDTVRISISDNGRGIPEEDIPRVFESFFSTKEEGTGLGLAIAKRIVERHGGKIEVASRIGQGTSFIITFPS